MKKLSTKQTKVLRIFHIIFSVMWLGGCMAISFFPFFIYPKNTSEVLIYTQVIDFLDYWMIIVGGVGSFITGLIYSIWTKWGFFKHNWLIVKWIIVILQTLYGTFVLGLWLLEDVVRIAENMTGDISQYPEYFDALYKHTTGGIIQLVFLIFLYVITVWKPWRSNMKKAE